MPESLGLAVAETFNHGKVVRQARPEPRVSLTGVEPRSHEFDGIDDAAPLKIEECTCLLVNVLYLLFSSH